MELCGNAIGCIFQVEENRECGETSKCLDCRLRNDIVRSFAEKVPVYKDTLERRFVIQGEVVQKYFVFTTKYLTWNGEEFVLIVFDDVTEIEQRRADAQRLNMELEGMIQDQMARLVRMSVEIARLDLDDAELRRTVQHHVGNALQVVSSLVNLKSGSRGAAGRSGPLVGFGARFGAIIALYRCMSLSELDRTVRPARYFPALFAEIARASPAVDGIRPEFDIPNGLELGLETLLALGLIVNEVALMVSSQAPLAMHLGIRADGPDVCRFEVRIEVGGFDRCGSEEESLIEAFAGQLGTILELSFTGGVELRLSFPIDAA